MEYFVLAITAILVFLYILAVIKVHNQEFRTMSEKTKWLALIVLLPVAGAIYFLFFKPVRTI